MVVYLGRLANEIGGGRPLMQRVGDFRGMGKRSTAETFNEDLRLPPSYPVTAGDLDSPCRPRSCATSGRR